MEFQLLIHTLINNFPNNALYKDTLASPSKNPLQILV